MTMLRKRFHLLLLAIPSLALLISPTVHGVEINQVFIHSIEDRYDGKLNGYYFRIVVELDLDDVTTVTATTPGGATVNLSKDSTQPTFTFKDGPYPDIGTLRAAYPLGDYNLNFDSGSLVGSLPHTAELPQHKLDFKTPLDRELVGQIDPTIVLSNPECGDCFYGSLDLVDMPSDHYLISQLAATGITLNTSGAVLSSIPLVEGQSVYRFGVALGGGYSLVTRLYTGIFQPAVIAGKVFTLGSGGIVENRIDIGVASQHNGTTYYVDSLAGNDANSGTDLSAPLRSLNAVNNINLQPGDNVLLKRGSSWFGEALLLHESGNIYNFIRVGAYGDGPLPKIRPVETYTNGWTTTDGGTTYTQQTSKPASGDDFLGAVWENESRMNFVGSLGELNQPGQAFWDNGTLHIRPSPGINPNSGSDIYRVPVVVAPGGSNLGVDLRGDFYIVEDLDIAYVAHYGIGQQYKISRNNGFNIVRRNVVAHSFHDLIAFGQLGGTVEANVVHNTQDFGIACLDYGDGHTRDVIVRNNIVALSPIGLTPEGSVDNIRWHDNLVLWSTRGASAVSEVNAATELRPINNSFIGNRFIFNEIGMVLGGPGVNFDTGTVIENNSFISSTRFALAWAPGGQSFVSSIKNNVVDGSNEHAISLTGEIQDLEIIGNIITNAHSPIAGSSAAAMDIGPAVQNIKMENNTLFNNDVGVLIRGLAQGNSLTNNLILDSRDFALFISDISNISDSENNTYHNSDGSTANLSVAMQTLSLENLKNLGLEQDSNTVDPLLMDPQTGDFKLQSNSPAIDSGFDTGRVTDMNNTTVRDEPSVTNSGTGLRDYVDRGALEF